MKYQTFIIRLLASLLFLGLSVSAPREYYIQIPIQNTAQITTITRLVSIHTIINNQVYAYAVDKNLQDLTDKGFSYEILAHPNENFTARMDGFNELSREWDSYLTYESFIESTYRFGVTYADICQVFNIGTTVEGREILAVKITDNINQEEDEPEFLYTAQMHGNELIGSITALNLIEHMLSNYGIDPQITHLIDNVEIWIVPLNNPDGAYIGGNDSIEDAIRHNANGVDLNRNFPDWMNGPHPDGNDWQPETIALMEFADEHHFVLASNIHSGAELANYPWDTTPVLTADDEWWQIVCHTYADTVQSYSPQGYFTDYDDGIVNGYQWYETNGNRQDYMNYYHHCKEMTLELSDVQMLPEDELLDYWEWNRAALLNYMEECLYGVRGIVTNTQGEPLSADVTIPGYDMDNTHVVTDPDLGNYHRMLAPGTYDIQIEAFGYESQLFENVVVSLYDVVILDAVLESLPEIDVQGTVTNALTNQPIEGAVIQIVDSPYDPENSGADGGFLFETIYAGTYNLHVYAQGYSAFYEEILFEEGMDPVQIQLTESDLVSFESGSLPDDWITLGSSGWVVVSDAAFDGLYSARSGDIDDDQISSLSITVDVPMDDEISFFCKVACEDDDNNNWDFLFFAIDGEEMERWDGIVNWHQETYPVSAGEHTFTWTYSKDGSVSHYDDAGWIDAINLPTGPDLTDVIPGDANLDGLVNVMDIVMTVNFILHVAEPDYEQFVAADMDGNGILNVLDLIGMVNLILNADQE